MDDDVLDKIWKILINDDEVGSYVRSERDGYRIKFFEYPETADYSGPVVVLVPLINAMPSGYADETWVTYDYLLHVDVWSKKRTDSLALATRIRDLLWDKLGFKQNDSTDEYGAGIYRDARRYEGVLHRGDLDSI